MQSRSWSGADSKFPDIFCVISPEGGMISSPGIQARESVYKLGNDSQFAKNDSTSLSGGGSSQALAFSCGCYSGTAAMRENDFGEALGIDHKTVQRYIDFLGSAFLLRNLPPYPANLKKRLVKRPRIYLRDSGLLHALMRVQDLDMLYGQPWLGQSWEGFVIEQLMATLEIRNRAATPYYFRSSDGYEIDLLLDWGTELCAVEIKLTSNPSKQEVDRLNKVADMVGATRRFLLCRTAKPFGNDTLTVTNPVSWLKTF